MSVCTSSAAVFGCPTSNRRQISHDERWAVLNKKTFQEILNSLLLSQTQIIAPSNRGGETSAQSRDLSAASHGRCLQDGGGHCAEENNGNRSSGRISLDAVKRTRSDVGRFRFASDIQGERERRDNLTGIEKISNDAERGPVKDFKKKSSEDYSEKADVQHSDQKTLVKFSKVNETQHLRNSDSDCRLVNLITQSKERSQLEDDSPAEVQSTKWNDKSREFEKCLKVTEAKQNLKFQLMQPKRESLQELDPKCACNSDMKISFDDEQISEKTSGTDETCPLDKKHTNRCPSLPSIVTVEEGKTCSHKSPTVTGAGQCTISDSNDSHNSVEIGNAMPLPFSGAPLQAFPLHFTSLALPACLSYNLLPLARDAHDHHNQNHGIISSGIESEKFPSPSHNQSNESQDLNEAVDLPGKLKLSRSSPNETILGNMRSGDACNSVPCTENDCDCDKISRAKNFGDISEAQMSDVNVRQDHLEADTTLNHVSKLKNIYDVLNHERGLESAVGFDHTSPSCVKFIAIPVNSCDTKGNRNPKSESQICDISSDTVKPSHIAVSPVHPKRSNHSVVAILGNILNDIPTLSLPISEASSTDTWICNGCDRRRSPSKDKEQVSVVMSSAGAKIKGNWLVIEKDVLYGLIDRLLNTMRSSEEKSNGNEFALTSKRDVRHWSQGYSEADEADLANKFAIYKQHWNSSGIRKTLTPVVKRKNNISRFKIHDRQNVEHSNGMDMISHVDWLSLWRSWPTVNADTANSAHHIGIRMQNLKNKVDRNVDEFSSGAHGYTTTRLNSSPTSSNIVKKKNNR